MEIDWPSRDQVFKLRGGETVVDGKSRHPDVVRLHLRKGDAFDVAMRILKAIELCQDDTKDQYLPEIALFGELEPTPEAS